MRVSFSNSLLSLACASSLLAGCSGNSPATLVPGSSRADLAARASVPQIHGKTALPQTKKTIFRFVVKRSAPHGGRQPRYVSAATKSFTAQVTEVEDSNGDNITPSPAPALVTVNVTNTGTPGSPCVADNVNPGNYVCTIAIQLYVGNDTLHIRAYDATGGTGNVLSSQNPVLSVVEGVNNPYTIALDGNASAIALTASGSCEAGAVGSAFGSVGTTPITFNATYTDADGKTIVAPGLPILSVGGYTTSGTITGTGGNVGVSVNQSTQSFTLTPSTSSVSATIDVQATPANSSGVSDGLSFTRTASFTFDTGPAPPAHNFLAGVEQSSTNAGQIDFFNVTLGGSGGPDTFAAFSPATLAVTNSTNQGKPDVDNPVSLTWDSSGDLLIGNGGTGTGGDTGNLACVPAGAIATGANTSTTATAYVDDPVGIAYDARDGAVALANNPTSASEQVAEYALSGDYTADPTSDDISASGFGAFADITLPTLAAGTFAAALTTGTESDPSHSGSGQSKIAVLAPGGQETDITDTSTYAIDEPRGLAWDAQNDQIAIANFSSFHKDLSFYTTAGSQVKVVNTGLRNYHVAASPNGTIAVAGNTAFGYPQVQVYDNTTARNAIGGPIPYNSTTTSCGSTYIYGQDTVVVNALLWLSNTKLLVGVQASTSGVATSYNGFYIYDTTALAVPAGYDDVSCNAFAAAPGQTGFVHTSNKPLAAAFKP